MENSVTAYIAYCKKFADNHIQIKDFDYGGSDRILNRERSRIKYPLLWAEIPDFSQKKEEEDGGIFSGALVILHNYKPGNNTQRLEREESTYQIMLQIVTRIFEEAADGEIILINKEIKIEPIDPWSGDNDLGWRIDFSLQTESGCFQDDINEGIWKDLI